MAHYTQVAPRLVIVQSFTYRGKAEEFSNRYSFKGPAPTSGTAWKALADKVIAALRPCFNAPITFVRAYGYQPSAIGADWVYDYSSPGPPVGRDRHLHRHADARRCGYDAAIHARHASRRRQEGLHPQVLPRCPRRPRCRELRPARAEPAGSVHDVRDELHAGNDRPSLHRRYAGGAIVLLPAR